MAELCPDDFGLVWSELACEGRFDVIDMLSDVEQGKIDGLSTVFEKIPCKSPFSKNKKVHEAVCDFLREHGIGI